MAGKGDDASRLLPWLIISKAQESEIEVVRRYESLEGSWARYQ